MFSSNMFGHRKITTCQTSTKNRWLNPVILFLLTLRFFAFLAKCSSCLISCHCCHTILQTFCAQTCIHAYTYMYIHRVVQPTFPVWWATSITSSVVEESFLTMRGLCFCASTVGRATAPRQAETTTYALSTRRPSPPSRQRQMPITTRTTSLTPTTIQARKG